MVPTSRGGCTDKLKQQRVWHLKHTHQGLGGMTQALTGPVFIIAVINGDDSSELWIQRQICPEHPVEISQPCIP